MNIKGIINEIITQYETSNPLELCNCLDITTIKTYLYRIRGYCLIEENQTIICISDTLSELETDFVCAHELGHAILHKGINRMFMDSSTFFVNNKFENEADAFAAQLLLTTKPIEDYCIMSDELAKMLNVKVNEVQERLQQLGINN